MNRFPLTAVTLALIAAGSPVFAQVERLAPANPHRPGTSGTVIGVPLPGTNRPNTPPATRPQPPQTRPQPPQPRPQPPANPFANLTSRLGLVGSMPYATGRYYAVQQNGQVAHLLGNYKIMSDGRLMLFPAGSDLRLDVHSANFFPNTNVIGARFSGLNLTAARNTGGGIINFGVGGSGPVTARIQEQFQMVGNHSMPVNSPTQTIRFVPN